MKFIEIIIDDGEGMVRTIRVEQDVPNIYYGLGGMAGEAAEQLMDTTRRDFRAERRARKAFRKSPLGVAIKHIGETLSSGLAKTSAGLADAVMASAPVWPAPGSTPPEGQTDWPKWANIQVDEMRGMRPSGVDVDEPNDVDEGDHGVPAEERDMVVINPNIPKRDAPSHPVSDNEQSLVDDGDVDLDEPITVASVEISTLPTHPDGTPKIISHAQQVMKIADDFRDRMHEQD